MEKFVFTLSRSTTKGKNTLKQNQMLSANDRLHHHVNGWMHLIGIRQSKH